jgi:putative ABC transport system permease protein
VSAGSFPLVVTGGSEAVRTRVSYASGSFFDVMGVQPIAGRVFLPEETKYGGPKAALVSYGFWQRQLGARADLSEARLNVDGALCNVVGVAPPGFDYPADTEVWVTTGIEPPNTSRTAHNWPVVGRLRAGVTIEQARAEASAIGQQIRQEKGAQLDAASDFAMTDFALTPLQQHLTRNVRSGLWLLLGAVGLLLLVACANVANLLLAQLTGRQREFAVRAALGAGRWRVARQLVVENLLLTLAAAGAGALLASFGVDALLRLEGGSLPRLNPVGVDGRVLLFACALAVLIGVALGCLPALRFGRQDLQATLKEGGRGQSAGALSHRLRGALVIAEVALSVALLIGAGLLLRSFAKLQDVKLGFEPENLLTMRISLPRNRYPGDQEAWAFYTRLLEEVKALPGVRDAALTSLVPFGGGGTAGEVQIPGKPAAPDGSQPSAAWRVVSPGYLRTLGVPLRGRDFDERDTAESQPVTIISEEMARRYWPGEDPLGQPVTLRSLGNRTYTIIGVAGDIRSFGPEAEPGPMSYVSTAVFPRAIQSSLVVRTRAEPTAQTAAVRGALRSIDANVPVYDIRTIEQLLYDSLGSRRFNMLLLGSFAGVALLLASVGLFGVMAYLVSQRTHEIGIRLALGARPRDVFRLVIGRGMLLAAIGAAVGLVAAFGLARYLETLLFQIRPTDALAFTVAPALLLGVALLACYVPARRR